MVSTADVTVLSPDSRIAAWERRTRWYILFAAVAPFLTRLLPWSDLRLDFAVDLITWVVFAVDLGVHLRISPTYWRTARGIFDIAIVVLTFPWYVFPGVAGTSFMVVFRWARLARLLFAGETGRRFTGAVRRLGTLGIALTLTSLLAALIVMRHEPAEAGFETFSDAIWWAVVSFTTVGYGDLYPTTPEGRLAGGMMMFMGLLALGTVSGVLASTFVGGDSEERASEERTSAEHESGEGGSGATEAADHDPQGAAVGSGSDQRLLEELAELRRQVQHLTQLLGASPADQVGVSPADADPGRPARDARPDRQGSSQ